MLKRCADYITLALILAIAVFPLGPLWNASPVNAAQRTLTWSIVNTPNNGTGGMIASPSEINAFALGPDNRTFYSADTDNTTVSIYKSIDAGVTWYPDIGKRLTDPTVGAQMPVWDVAVSPDDANFVIAITDGGPGLIPGPGPKKVFASSDGGVNWKDTGFPLLAAGEYISCAAISKIYASTNLSRDIAIATRNGSGTGKVWVRQSSSTLSGTWKDNTPTTFNGDFTSLKFSPNYDTDYTICVIYSNTSTYFTLGLHDTTANTTKWNDPSYGTRYPVNFSTANISNIIKSGLELPSDFNGTLLEQLGIFASIQAENSPTENTTVVYINTNVSTSIFKITPPMSGPIPGRISSIAYEGSESSGILLAGEVYANPAKGLVNVWECSNAQSTTIGGATWIKSDELKSPTGGAGPNSGRANAIVRWSPNGINAYCGTSSENSTIGGTGTSTLPLDTTRWPFSKTIGCPLDESAFSRSINSGLNWNQLSLIDTSIDQLTDVAAMEIGENMAAEDISSVLYLATENTTNNVANFSSVWRSTSDPLGSIWERVLLHPNKSTMGSILRVNARDQHTSKAIVFADLQTDNITYSPDRGQSWQNIHSGVKLKDISLESDTRMYILEDYTVRQVNKGDSGWTLGAKLSTNLDSPGHTIWTPDKSPVSTEIVLVGSDFGTSSVAWADYSQFIAKFTTLKPLPSNNSYVHVISDSQYEQNQFIYAGVNINSLTSNEGTIYRWKIGTNTSWDELEPTNNAFFGIESLNGLLYGLWNYCTTDLGYTGGGVDRTLYPTIKVPPPPEWDSLISGLPQPPSPPTNYPVKFTREPTSLKVSSGTNNTLWAIDDRHPYSFDLTKGKGCLWSYADSVSRLGPWPTTPPTGGLVGADPVTGRSQQIDFEWRPLTDIYGYDLLIAKDVNFTMIVSHVTPVNNVTGAWTRTAEETDTKTGAWVVTPADQTQPSVWISPGIFETGRPYYWRVRGSRAMPFGGKEVIIHSPWSPVMLFSIQPGFAVKQDYNGPILLTPVDGPCQGCLPPLRFSWTPIKNASKYEFILASDPELKVIITKTTTSSTAYEYKNQLDLSKPYYWQVKAVSPVVSDASPVGTFTVASAADTSKGQQTQPEQKQPTTQIQGVSDLWIGIIMVITMVLLILLTIYAFITRQRD